jgi:hypothetical protein
MTISIVSYKHTQLGHHLITNNTHTKVIEALPIDLQKNFTLLKEMDGYAQGLE